MDKRLNSKDEVLSGRSSLRKPIPHDPLESTSDLIFVSGLEKYTGIRCPIEPMKIITRGIAVHANVTIGAELLKNLPGDGIQLGVLESRPQRVRGIRELGLVRLESDEPRPE